MKADVKQLAKEEWQKHLESLGRNNIRILICPQCGEVHKGKYYSRLIACGCGWKLPKDEK